MSTDDLYGLLAIPPTASAEDIRLAFRSAARRFHPDANRAAGAAAEFRRISEAHARLSDPAQRARYNALLKLPSAGPLLSLGAWLSRTQVPALAEPQIVYALVEVRPAAAPAKLQPPPVNLALVLDCSTSMQGERLDQVKVAVLQLIDSLRAADVLSIISFSDKAHVLVGARPCTPDHKAVAKARVSALAAAGGTEILQGLLRGMLELRQHISGSTVNHLLLLTDGRTYGDEGDCLLLGSLAAVDGVSISGLGIGEEWNDRFLDELTRSTGGSAAFIGAPDQVAVYLQAKVRGLGAAFAERLSLGVLADPGVSLLSAFRLSPEPSPLSSDDLPLPLGGLPTDQALGLLLKFQLPAIGAGPHPIARLALTGDVPGAARFGDRLTLDLWVQAEDRPTPFQPPPALVDACTRVSQYTLQEQAFQKADAGDRPGAKRLLALLGTRLLAAGQAELARVASGEAERLGRSQPVSETAKKQLKYGTRALALAAPPRR